MMKEEILIHMKLDPRFKIRNHLLKEDQIGLNLKRDKIDLSLKEGQNNLNFKEGRSLKIDPLIRQDLDQKENLNLIIEYLQKLDNSKGIIKKDFSNKDLGKILI